MEEKVKIIDEIVKRHPYYGVKKGWSWYTGGMKDTGEWYFRKMLDVPVSELQEFLDNTIKEEKESYLITQRDVNFDAMVRVGNGFMRESDIDFWQKFQDEQDKRILGL